MYVCVWECVCLCVSWYVSVHLCICVCLQGKWGGVQHTEELLLSPRQKRGKGTDKKLLQPRERERGRRRETEGESGRGREREHRFVTRCVVWTTLL